jgi:uncharacterized cupin superfamily protein
MSSATTDRRRGLVGDKGMKAPVDCATTVNITLSGEQTIDGVVTSESRVLVKNQNTASENGIYVSSTGSWTRDIDANKSFDFVDGTLVPIANGGQAYGIYQVTTANPITIGTTALTFSVAFTAQAVSAYMQTLLAASTATAARTILEVAPRATRIDVASVAGTVNLTTAAPDTDDIRITGDLTITGFTVAAGRVLRCTAGGAFTLTNNASIVTNSGVNIVAESGATFSLRATAADTVEVLNYTAVTETATQLQPVSATVSANAMTLSLDPTTLDFRSTTLTSGTPTTVSNIATITTTISSGSTGGTTNAVQSDIVIAAINNAGTMELAWINLAGGTDLSETGLISTTAEGGAGGADSASVWYSTVARSNVAYRVVGIARSTQATAGTWVTTPSLVQGQGGNALAAMQSMGYGQTMQDVTGSRVAGTTYYNTTGKPIKVYIQGNAGASSGEFSFAINGGTAVPFARSDVPSGTANLCGTFDVPINASYRATASVGSLNLVKWWEQR